MRKRKYRCGEWKKDGNTHRKACVSPRGSCRATVTFHPVAGHYSVVVRKSGSGKWRGDGWDYVRTPRVTSVGAIHIGDAKFDADKLLSKCNKVGKPHYDFAGARRRRKK